MFTGLVAAIGKIASLSKHGRDMRLLLESPLAASLIKKGDSIAVNGVCLTAETVNSSMQGSSFVAFASEETLLSSNLSQLTAGSFVNLELALAMGERLGGHMVSGHVDGLAKICEIKNAGRSRQVVFSFPSELDVYIVPKGSVCIDGISLTVNQCANGFFDVNIIPETWAVTIAADWKIGYAANLETDILGKYVAKMLNTRGVSKGADVSVLGMDFFLKNGF